MAEQEQLIAVKTVEEEAGPKSPFASRTIHFNWISALLVPAIRPFLPKHLQESPYLVDAVLAWFALGNIALRFCTKEAVSFFWKYEIAIVQRIFFRRSNDETLPTTPPGGGAPNP